MERNIPELHSDILKIFREVRKKDTGFKFTLRKSDINKRLSQGYWFHGNEHYIAISFWSGMDWVRKVPNISLMINIETGNMSLEFSSKDSSEKRELLHKKFYSIFNSNYTEEYVFIVDLHYNFYTDKHLAINDFIINQKQEIDNTIEANKREFATKQNNKNRIGFIDDDEYKINMLKIRKYEQKKTNKNLPYSIDSISINKFGLLENIELNDIPSDAQWIFITGENNSGKTTFLKALSIAICNGSVFGNIRYKIPNNYTIKIALNRNGKTGRTVLIKSNKKIDDLEILSKGFVAYGPTRINIRDLHFTPTIHRNFRSLFSKPYKSLFNTASLLIDIGFLYSRRREFPDEVKFYDNKYYFITQIITQLCDSIVDIHFGRRLEFFLTEDFKRTDVSKGLRFEELSSGFRNIIAMVSDMMIHLYFQQPDITDPSELVGIVIIDEIDLHFHPKLQRDFIIKLGELFPRIQFIVSTHNPIPLLGAPKGSVFLNITRSTENEIQLRRLEKLEKEIANLLPNTIYTSDIFGLDDIESVQNINENDVILEDYYVDISKDDNIDSRIRQFEQSELKFPSNLFKDGKKK